MKHLVSVLVLGTSLLISLPILGIGDELEKAQKVAEKTGDEVQLVLSPAQAELLRVIIAVNVAALYTLPLFLFASSRDKRKPKLLLAGAKERALLPPVEIKGLLPPAKPIDADGSRG